MSLRDEWRQEWDAPSIADEALLESLTGDVRRALCRVIREEVVSAFYEGFTVCEVEHLPRARGSAALSEREVNGA